MSARSRGRRRRGGGHEEDEEGERWLLTYADMITLLMALFIVMFAISNVNTSKFESLQSALQEAFSGKILPGGKSIQQTAGSDQTEQSTPEPPIPAIAVIPDQAPGKEDEEEARKEEEDFEALKRKLDAYARRHGLQRDLQTTIERRGLVIRLLTDRVLFDSGEALLKPRARPILGHIGRLLVIDRKHPVVVEGHTDNQPITTAIYPSNWELSGARASSVVRYLIDRRVRPKRMEASGFADLRPINSNRTPGGRLRNRRVEIVLTRLNHRGQGGPTE